VTRTECQKDALFLSDQSVVLTPKVCLKPLFLKNRLKKNQLKTARSITHEYNGKYIDMEQGSLVSHN
jgi:hypothetical protein